MRFRRNPLNRPGLYFKGGGGSNKRPDDSQDEKELARIAGERWQSYQNTYVPAENKYIDEMRNYDNPQRMEQMTRMAATGTRDAFSEAIQSDINTMTSAGINPNSGTFKQAIHDRGTDMASTEAANTTKTQQAVQDQKVQGLQNVVGMGMGQSTTAMAGMTDVAAASAADAEQKAIKSFNNDSASKQTVGMIAGAGTRAAIGYGTQNKW